MKTQFHRNPTRQQIKRYLDLLIVPPEKTKAARPGEEVAAYEKTHNNESVSKMQEENQHGR
jgi:hypothetical protein